MSQPTDRLHLLFFSPFITVPSSRASFLLLLLHYYYYYNCHSHNEPLMKMASIQSFCNGFFSIFLLLIHLGCFTIFSPNNPDPNRNQNNLEPQPKRRKVIPRVSPSPPPPTGTDSNLLPRKSFSILSYLNHLRCFRNKPTYNTNNITSPPLPQQQQQEPTSWPLTLTPNHLTMSSPQLLVNNDNIPLTKQSSFGRHNGIFPCTACGEVLSKPHHLELHQATKHSLSELRDSDSGRNIVQIIFRSGWKGSKSHPPTIHLIFKIHNTPKTVTRFEEYREMVRSRAARMSRVVGPVDERCLVDGNERLRFHCATILCPLGSPTTSSQQVVGACGSQYCRACGIVRHGFVGKQVDLDGIVTHQTSWGAHLSLPEDLEREFAYLNVRRAMFVCRVVAGRVAHGGGGGQEEEKGALVFDSVAQMDDELLVFNPRAVLPCFLIVYSST